MTPTDETQNRSASHPAGPGATNRPDGSSRAVKAVLAGVGLLAILALGVIPRVWLSRSLKRQEAQEAAAAPNVFVTPAESSAASVVVQLSGTMSPITEAPILARTDGYLAKRLVDIGDRVHAGQLLAVITAPDLDQQVLQAKAALEESKSTLQQAQAALDQAKANAGLASVTAERWAALVKRGAVSRQANDNYQFAYSAQLASVGIAAASVAAAGNSVGSNTANLDRFRELQGFEQVRAPFDGVITQRNVDDGALVTATSTLLFRIAKNDVLRTFIDVPQINAPSIRVGDSADLTFIQFPSHVFHGEVTRTADSLDLNTRTLLTEVDIDNKDQALLPGMYATVAFRVPRTVTSVLIPSESLIFRADGTTVAVVTDQHIIQFRKVALGHDYGAALEVVSGLRAGESVVVNPSDTVIDGVRVNPVLVKQAAGSLSPAPANAAAPAYSSARPSPTPNTMTEP